MGRRAVALLALVFVLPLSAQATEQSPAFMIPAGVMTYQEFNLTHWHLGSEGGVPLEEVFERSGILPAERALVGDLLAPGPGDDTAKAMAFMWEPLRYVGPRLGWTVATRSLSRSELPGAPGFLVVAQVRDPTAFLESVRRLLCDLEEEYEEKTRPDGVKVLVSSMGPALALGPDWAALCNPPGLVDVVARLAASGGAGSLGADPRYQRALRGLPQDALITQYVSPTVFKVISDLITSESRPAPGLPLPVSPKDGVAWAVRASLDPQEGRNMLSVTWTIDGDLASSVTAAAIFAVLSPVFDRGREMGRKSGCEDHMKELTAAMCRYAADHGRFPEADRWTVELAEYVKDPRVFQCPDDRTGAECSYAMNSGLSGKPQSAVKDAAPTIVIYETAHPGACPRGGPSDLASPPRHLGGNHFGFADGSVGWVPEAEAEPPTVSW